jgi:hypothetical protein
MENNNQEQRYEIRFCVKGREGATDTYRKIKKAFDDDSVSCAQVFQCHRDFVNWRETAEDEPRSGHHAPVKTSTNSVLMRDFVYQDRRLTIPAIPDELSINECIVVGIVNTRREHERSVCIVGSRKLNNDRKALSAEMHERLETEPDILIGSQQVTKICFSNTNSTRHSLQDRKEHS